MESDYSHLLSFWELLLTNSRSALFQASISINRVASTAANRKTTRKTHTEQNNRALNKLNFIAHSLYNIACFLAKS